MQTLRKKTSPLKSAMDIILTMLAVFSDKNETSRFLGEGVSFKAKLIGILEVSEARGDRMCQEALADLKMAIRAAGEHKQRITINIAIDGLRLRDEKTGDSLYHHPVHKISFIAQDMSDSRAFGYIFGSPDTGHRFFGIKTDKAASQVVIAMRDLFQVVFALKKKEIELAKQHLDKSRYSTSPLFSDRGLSSGKLTASHEAAAKTAQEIKSAASAASETHAAPAVADLVDLELELSSLQQGLTQMERITPSDPFGRSEDPFGDSFTSFSVLISAPYPPTAMSQCRAYLQQKPILPPPPSSGRDRSARVSESSSIFSPKAPHLLAGGDSSSAADLLQGTHDTAKDFSFNEFSSHDEPSSGDWFTPPAGNSLFEDAPSSLLSSSEKERQHEQAKQEILSQFDVFTDLDPLGTGRIRPYVDKKHFFQDLKNPPKKVLNELASECTSLPTTTPTASNGSNFTAPMNKSSSSICASDPFGEDPFDQADPFVEAECKVFENELSEYRLFHSSTAARLSEASSDLTQLFKSDADFNSSTRKLFDSHSFDVSSESEAPDPPPRPVSTLIQPPPLPPKKQSMLDLTSKPPPRPPPSEPESQYDTLDKFSAGTKGVNDESPPLPVPARKIATTERFESDFVVKEETAYLTPIGLLPPPRSSRRSRGESPGVPPAEETLTQLSLDTLEITLSQLTLSGLNDLAAKLNIPASQLSNMTLVQLTDYLSNFIKTKNNERKEEDAGGCRMDAKDVMEPHQQQTFPSAPFDLSAPESAAAISNFADFNQFNTQLATQQQQQPIMTAPTYDRYAAFRELLQEEATSLKPGETTVEDGEEEQEAEDDEEANEAIAEAAVEISDNVEASPITDSSPNCKEENFVAEVAQAQIQLQMDRYAALREISMPNESDRRSMEDIDTIEEDEEEEDVKEEIAADDMGETETQEEFAETEPDIINDDKTSSVENDLNVEDVKNDNTPMFGAVALKPDASEVNLAQTGSLSDVVSGSSPEIDDHNEASKKSTTVESWAIFEQPQTPGDDAARDAKAVHSEEGVSPWSSDSKEFGNSSPTDWQARRGSGSVDRWSSGGLWSGRSQEGWWDTSAEPETAYYNRRSTDSYDDDYDVYDRPRRSRRQGQTWCNQPTGGHSSSSRDVSPWEEEPRRRDGRQSWSSRHSRLMFDRHTDRRRHTDSWDEDDDYEDYEDERMHWRAERAHPRDLDEWDERRMRAPRRRELDRERWCCPDYDPKDVPMLEPQSRYSSGRWSNPERRKLDERYYTRDSQESPWEDEYGNEIEPHYMTARRTRVRPSSATEIDRKTGEIKARGQFQMAPGSSDSDRDRRYKASRRSKSRDSQYAEPPRLAAALRPGRKPHPKFDEFVAAPPQMSAKEAPLAAKKVTTASARKTRSKESPKTDDAKTFPRKSRVEAADRHIQTPTSQQSMFENDFVQFEEFAATTPDKWYKKPSAPKQSVLHGRFKQKSLFEDDFSPTEKVDKVAPTSRDQNSGQPQQQHEEAEDCLGANNFEPRIANGRKRAGRSVQLDSNLKKSESVNIFARESDPFDDDFFISENANGDAAKWAHHFDNIKRT